MIEKYDFVINHDGLFHFSVARLQILSDMFDDVPELLCDVAGEISIVFNKPVKVVQCCSQEGGYNNGRVLYSVSAHREE